MGRTVSLSRRASIALVVPIAVLAACGGSSTPAATTSGAAGPTTQASIAAEVPAAIKADAPLQIASDASYAPNEFVDPNSGDLVGWDIELAKDVCAVLGVACTINNVTFSDIIPALLENPSKYQMSFSSFTPTQRARGLGHRLHHLLPGGRGVVGEGGWSDDFDSRRYVRSHGGCGVRHHRGVRRLGIHGEEAGRRCHPRRH